MTDHNNHTKVIIKYFSHVNLHLINETEYVLSLRVNKLRKKKVSSFFLLLQNPVFKNNLKKWNFLENSEMLWVVNDATRDAIVW